MDDVTQGSTQPGGAAPVQPVDASMEQAPQPQGDPEPNRVEETQPDEQLEPAQEPQQVNEGQDAPSTDPPVQTNVSEEDEDFDPLAAYGNFNQGQYDFRPNEEGVIDPYELAHQVEQRMTKQMTMQMQEMRAWDKIEKKYGEQMTPARRELILNARIANAVNGKNTSLTTLADKVMKEFTSAKSEGRAEAGTSTRVQKAASLETATSNTGPSKDDGAVYDSIIAGDNQATTDLLSDWLKEGKI